MFPPSLPEKSFNERARHYSQRPMLVKYRIKDSASRFFQTSSPHILSVYSARIKAFLDEVLSPFRG